MNIVATMPGRLGPVGKPRAQVSGCFGNVYRVQTRAGRTQFISSLFIPEPLANTADPRRAGRLAWERGADAGEA